MITGKLYDHLKFLAQILLPALGTLYFGLAEIWGFPGATQVVGTIVVVDTFLGVLLGISQSNYNRGVMKAGDIVVENTGEGGKRLSLELDNDPHMIGRKREVHFKVRNE